MRALHRLYRLVASKIRVWLSFHMEIKTLRADFSAAFLNVSYAVSISRNENPATIISNLRERLLRSGRGAPCVMSSSARIVPEARSRTKVAVVVVSTSRVLIACLSIAVSLR